MNTKEMARGATKGLVYTGLVELAILTFIEFFSWLFTGNLINTLPPELVRAMLAMMLVVSIFGAAVNI